MCVCVCVWLEDSIPAVAAGSGNRSSATHVTFWGWVGLGHRVWRRCVLDGCRCGLGHRVWIGAQVCVGWVYVCVARCVNGVGVRELWEVGAAFVWACAFSQTARFP